MNPFISALAGAAVRWLITVAAAQGVVLSDDTATQIVSGVIALGMLAWSWKQKRGQSKAVEKAADTGVVPS